MIKANCNNSKSVWLRGMILNGGIDSFTLWNTAVAGWVDTWFSQDSCARNNTSHIPSAKSKLHDHISTEFNMPPEGRQRKYSWTSLVTITGDRSREPIFFAFLQTSESHPKLRAAQGPKRHAGWTNGIIAPRRSTLFPTPQHRNSTVGETMWDLDQILKRKDRKTPPTLENWAWPFNFKKPILHWHSFFFHLYLLVGG